MAHPAGDPHKRDRGGAHHPQRAKLTKLPTVRKPRRTAWTSGEARWFLEHTRTADPKFYAAYVLVLVLGLRKGEVLGLAWDQIDLDAAELKPAFQIQRVGKRILRREVKAENSEQGLPLPGLSVAALAQHRQTLADTGFGVAGSDLLFMTVTGKPIEPRNVNRYWDRQTAAAGVRRITVQDARRTCATLLRALNVHPGWLSGSSAHAQVTITLDVYTEVTDDATSAAPR